MLPRGYDSQLSSGASHDVSLSRYSTEELQNEICRRQLRIISIQQTFFFPKNNYHMLYVYLVAHERLKIALISTWNWAAFDRAELAQELTKIVRWGDGCVVDVPSLNKAISRGNKKQETQEEIDQLVDHLKKLYT